MKRWVPWLLLVVSLGLNLGLFGALGLERWRESRTLDLESEATEGPWVESSGGPLRMSEPVEPVEPAEPVEPTEEVVNMDASSGSVTIPEPRPADQEEKRPRGVLSPEPPSGSRLLVAQRLDRLADELRLSGEERTGFIDLQRRFFREVRRRRIELERLQRAVQREVMSSHPDPAEMRKGLTEVGEAYARLDAAFVQNVVHSREFLGPVQEKRFLELLGRMRLRTQSGEISQPRRRSERPRRRIPAGGRN